MTLWNPLNVFSSSQRRVTADAPVASFDPSRIGDPVGPSYTRPAIGFGETGSGATSEGVESRRQPIGFAPWDDEPAHRYVTEFSFKRHHDVPRASVTPDESVVGSDKSWQTPEPVAVEGVGDVGGSDEMNGEPSVVDVVEAEAKVPFYKREIGFHRKRTSVEDRPEDLDASAAPEDDHGALESAADVVPEQDDASEVELLQEEPEVGAVEAVAEVDLPTEADLPMEAEAAVDSDAGVESDASEKVPFYKREIAFRRKKTASEDTSEATAAEAPGDGAAVGAQDEPALEVGVAEVVVAAEVVGSEEEATEPTDMPSADVDVQDGPDVRRFNARARRRSSRRVD